MRRSAIRKLTVRFRWARRWALSAYGWYAVGVIWRTGVFDQAWYEYQSRRTFGSQLAAIRHYVETGRRTGCSPHPLVWPEVITPAGWPKAGREPVLRVLSRGSDVLSHPLFSPAIYVAQHPEAALHRRGPLAHFLANSDETTVLPTDLADHLTIGALVAGSHAVAAAYQAERLLDHSAVRRDWTPDPKLVPAAAHRADQSAQGVGPRVSVIMPIWNRAERVARAIESVQCQSFSRWELIVVDDGSTDASREWLLRRS